MIANSKVFIREKNQNLYDGKGSRDIVREGKWGKITRLKQS
jgi:hypothetical protein